MSLTFNGVAVSIASEQLPPDYTKPTVTPVEANWITSQNKVYTITKTSVNDADHATMFGNIVSAVSTQVQSTINTVFNTGTANFTAYATLTAVENDMDRHGLQSTISDFYATVTINVRED